MEDPAKPEIIVVSGSELDEALQSTEIWIHPTMEQWIDGPDLPVPLVDASGIVTPDSLTFLLIGGQDQDPLYPERYSSILSFHCQRGQCQWTKHERELSEPRAIAVAMFIPNRLGDCEKLWLKSTIHYNSFAKTTSSTVNWIFEGVRLI